MRITVTADLGPPQEEDAGGVLIAYRPGVVRVRGREYRAGLWIRPDPGAPLSGEHGAEVLALARALGISYPAAWAIMRRAVLAAADSPDGAATVRLGLP